MPGIKQVASFTTSIESELKDLVVRINGYELESNSILDIQINYGEPSKIGSILFMDNINLLETLYANIGDILIEYKDFNDVPYIETFSITRIMKSQGKENAPGINITFENTMTTKLKNTFTNFTFMNKSASEILEDISISLELELVILHDKEAEKFENVVVPTNVDLWSWMNNFIEMHGLKMFSDKYITYIAATTILNYEDIKDSVEISYQEEDKADSYRRIQEYANVLLDRNSLRDCPSHNIQSFNNENSIIIPEYIENEDVYNKQKMNYGNGFDSNGKMFSVFPTLGRQTFGPYLKNFNDNRYVDALNTNQSSEITIGGINLDKIYSKIVLNLSRAGNKTGFDELASGVYIITGVVDKINNNKFYSVITLQRSDYMKRES